MKYKITSKKFEFGLFDTLKTIELENGYRISAQYMGDYIGYNVTKGDETIDEFSTSGDDKSYYSSEWGEYYKYLDELMPDEEDED